MTPSVKDEILSLIDQAKATREMALSVGNRDEFGYPYIAGYHTATLRQIEKLVAKL